MPHRQTTRRWDGLHRSTTRPAFTLPQGSANEANEYFCPLNTRSLSRRDWDKRPKCQILLTLKQTRVKRRVSPESMKTEANLSLVMKRSQAFTLIELLVVIAIIAILASLLL